MSLIEFITAYRWQLIIIVFIANILFLIGVRLQKKYKRAQNGWFACGYMLVSLYVPTMLFILLVGK